MMHISGLSILLCVRTFPTIREMYANNVKVGKVNGKCGRKEMRSEKI